MYQIGYASTDHTTWGTEFPSGPDILFIPNPGERENIDATAYQHVGWVNVDQGNGKIFSTHANAAEYGDARPAYIRRLPQIGSRNHEVADAQTLTRGPSVIALPELLSEALEFCRTELDGFDGPDYDSDAEVCCQRSNVYIRELVRRLQSPADPRCPKCDAQVDERWDCCEVHEQTEQPMSFYDYAFIAAFTSAPSMSTASAHAIARLLTNHRTPPK